MGNLNNKNKQEDDMDIELIDLNQTQKQSAPEEEKKPIWKEALSLIVTFVVAFAIAFFIKEFIIINADVPSGSMENTIMTGDRMIGNRLAYLFSKPERGDIIIFQYPDDETQLFVKRIIGMPGETITIEDAKVYIGEGENQILLEETYLKEEWLVATGPYTYEVPENSYFVLGDNRNDSKDARYWENTYVKEDKIKGKAIFVYWPFSHLGAIK